MIGANGEQLGVVLAEEGLRQAKLQGLDLAEVAPLATPSVCKIMDYSKYKYEQARKHRETKKKHKTSGIKEIRMRPKISEHDYERKISHARKFLEEGNKVKFTLMFRGREVVYRDKARDLLEKAAVDLNEVGQPEKPPSREGRNMIMIMGSK